MQAAQRARSYAIIAALALFLPNAHAVDIDCAASYECSEERYGSACAYAGHAIGTTEYQTCVSGLALQYLGDRLPNKSGMVNLHCRVVSIDARVRASREADVEVNYVAVTANGWPASITESTISWKMEGDKNQPIQWQINRYSGQASVRIDSSVPLPAMEGPCNEVKNRRF